MSQYQSRSDGRIVAPALDAADQAFFEGVGGEGLGGAADPAVPLEVAPGAEAAPGLAAGSAVGSARARGGDAAGPASGGSVGVWVTLPCYLSRLCTAGPTPAAVGWSCGPRTEHFPRSSRQRPSRR